MITIKGHVTMETKIGVVHIEDSGNNHKSKNSGGLEIWLNG